MIQKGLFFIVILALLVSASMGNENKKNVIITPISDKDLQNYLVAPNFTTADLCTVRHDDSIAWAVTHWVIGNELYKSYQDPSLTCTDPYPFAVENIYFILYVETACSLYVSVDVEAVDNTEPSCPIPGALLALSSTYLFTLPGAGLYQIETPLDEPFEVNEPYFAGFFFADYVDTSWGVSIVTDDDPVPCINYNIWDTTIGFVDLTNTGFPSFPTFPGKMLLFSTGTPGGSGSNADPAITILTPEMDENISGETRIWAAETSGSGIIESVSFHFRGGSGGPWYEIGQDVDGSRAIRNGSDPSGTGDGWSINWNYGVLAEGTYWLKATVYDALERVDIDSILVSVDPTPPDLTMINPAALSLACLPFTISASTADENVTLVEFKKKDASTDYQVSNIILGQSGFEDYYCGPVAAAIAINYWFNMGYIYSMREGTQYIPIDTVVERLAENMLTNKYDGTYDDLFYGGFLQYIATHGNELGLDIYRNPDYHKLQVLFQEQEKLPILGLSGNPGLYLVVFGISGLSDNQNQYALKVSDPITGTIIDTYIKDGTSGAEVLYDGVWLVVDVAITVIGYTHTVDRDAIGSDDSSVDGWTYIWNSSDMVEDSLYFITAASTDATGRDGSVSSLIAYVCNITFNKGDFNDDTFTNIGDAILLSEFIYEGGTAPIGGAGRADANCDGNIDISDIIFMIKYIFEGGNEPCY